ncbi:PRC-barrel domain-containing protein [Rhizobium sp. LjRoot254]|uniref:PRC-barrel domain-containing protein n=1 Tax=Rhizobium sp. LjRoot254 TaxID=3342297 RepID=UPI003ED02248
MKRILATTALVVILSGGAAYAEMGNYTSQPTDINASQFIGQRIYAAETMPADSVQPGAEKDWADVGEINEVILDRSGKVNAVVLGVGGFLGMGEKAVAVPMTDVKFVKSGDGPDDFFLVVNTNKETLASAPAFVSAEEKAAQQAAAKDAATPVDPNATATDTTMTAPADTTADATAAKPADTTTATADTAAKPADTTTAADTSAAKTDTTTTAADTTAKKPADATTAMDDNAAATDTTTTASTTTTSSTQAMTDENRTRLTRPEITREGYLAAQATELTADKLTGARVYGPNDEDVGEINRIILDNNGQVDRVVLDIGGFLGVGEHQIAVTMDELNIVKNTKGDDFRVYIDANQANLKAQPEFKG